MPHYERARRTIRGDERPNRNETIPDAPDERILALARRRDLKFFIADSWGELLACSPDFDRSLLEQSRRKLEDVLAREDALTHPAYERLDPDTFLRLVPLPRGASYYYAVFVEPLKREGIAAAIRRFGITKRESEVLELLMAGLATPAVAERLFISEATVGEHVKSLFKKTKTNKRSELVARIFRNGSNSENILLPAFDD